MPPSGHYESLPGRGRRSDGLAALLSPQTRLYLGPDHLLSVAATGYTEEYRRFYYRDIQALTVHAASRTPRAIVLFVLALLVSLPLWLSGAPLATWGALAYGPLWLALLLHWLKGPMCACTLHTAIHEERLWSLSRQRACDHALARILERVSAAQGRLSAADLEPGAVARAGAPGAVSQAPARPTDGGLKLPDRGTVHLALFVVLLGAAGLSALQMEAPDSRLLNGLAIVLTLLTLGLVVAAAIRQAKWQISATPRRLVWVALGLVTFDVYAAIVLQVMEAVRRPSALTLPGAAEGQAPVAVHVASLLASLTIGAIGLLGVLRHRRELPQRPAAPRESGIS